MTGIVSAMADNVALGAYPLVLAGGGVLVSFMIGAASSAVPINYARRHQLHSEYSLPLLVEAFLLLCFGLLGGWMSGIDGIIVPATVLLLSFIMGLQNAVITKLSDAEIRTTHITGVVTDIGIEIGKLVYWNGIASSTRPTVLADRKRLATLSAIVACFFAGGVVGAFGFKHFGFLSTVPLALVLIALAIVTAIDDLMKAAGRSPRV